MARFVIIFCSVVLIMNAIILTIWLSPIYIILAPISIIVLYLQNKYFRKDVLLAKDGLDLGIGIDIENPDNPITTKVVLETNALDLGFLAIGSPGSGKSIAAIVMFIYYTITRKIGWCYWEGKGDKDIYQKTVASGCIPDYFFSSDLKHSDTTNIVAGPVSGVIEALTQTLITSDNEYYRTAQREALNAIVPMLKASGKPIILRDIYVALKLEEAGMYAIQIAKEAGAPKDVLAVAAQYYEQDPKQRANDVNGLITKMSLFVTGEIASRLNAYEPTLDLVQASKEGNRVYLHLPYSSIAKDISIFFTEQIGVIAKNRQLYESVRVPWPNVFDDWGKFFYPNIGAITARCRSAKIPVSYLFQSKGQTDSVDTFFTTEITDNIGAFCAFRINGQATANWAAEQFGTFETGELTMNSGYDSQTSSVTEKPRIKADTFKNLNAGEAYIDCLINGEGGRSSNERYKVRFPFPKMENPDAIDWPEIDTGKINDECNGLHLWRDFMDVDRLAKLKKEVVDKALSENEQQFDNIEINEL